MRLTLLLRFKPKTVHLCPLGVAKTVLQPYCNRAGTGAYAMDELSPRLSQKACKIAKFADALVRARTHHFRLLISRFQVRVLGGSLEKERVLQVKRDGAKSPRLSAGGFVTATRAFSATEPDRLTPIGLRSRVKPTIFESFVTSLKCELLYGHRFPSREAARIAARLLRTELAWLLPASSSSNSNRVR